MTDIHELAEELYEMASNYLKLDDKFEAIFALENAAACVRLWRQVGPDLKIAQALALYLKSLIKVGADKELISALAYHAYYVAWLSGDRLLIASGLVALARARQGTPSFEADYKAALESVPRVDDLTERNKLEAELAALA